MSGAEPFPVERVASALRLGDEAVIEELDRFEASTAEVVRLRILESPAAPARTVIGKYASGPAVADARRELRVHQLLGRRVALAPRLLGTWEQPGSGEALLLVMEDLEAMGYRLRSSWSEAQVHGAADALVQLHAELWDDLHLAELGFEEPMVSVTQSAQAWPSAAVTAHAQVIRQEAACFRDAQELTRAEQALLDEVVEAWERQFLARVKGRRALTLIHGDFHLMGNVFFADGKALPRVIDWSELKPGLPAHDLAYCLHAVPVEDRAVRDLALLRSYWDGLRAAGVQGYSWELCQWDYRFSLVTNLFQSVLQQSSYWFRATAAVVHSLDATMALRAPPPR